MKQGVNSCIVLNFFVKEEQINCIIQVRIVSKMLAQTGSFNWISLRGKPIEFQSVKFKCGRVCECARAHTRHRIRRSLKLQSSVYTHGACKDRSLARRTAAQEPASEQPLLLAQRDRKIWTGQLVRTALIKSSLLSSLIRNSILYRRLIRRAQVSRCALQASQSYQMHSTTSIY